MDECHCSMDYYSAIVFFHSNEERAIKFLREHGVLPTSVKCSKCKSNCTLREDKGVWRCHKRTTKDSMRVRCGFAIQDRKGTFLEDARIPAWKIILFVNHFLSHLWDHRTVTKNLGISMKTSVDWRSFCSEVAEQWFKNQESIGGSGLEVEIDETLISRRKCQRGRILKEV